MLARTKAVKHIQFLSNSTRNRCTHTPGTPSPHQTGDYIDPNLAACYRYTEDQVCTYPLDPVEQLHEPKYPASGFTPYEYLVYELTKNQWFANNTLFANRCRAPACLLIPLGESKKKKHQLWIRAPFSTRFLQWFGIESRGCRYKALFLSFFFHLSVLYSSSVDMHHPLPLRMQSG